MAENGNGWAESLPDLSSRRDQVTGGTAGRRAKELPWPIDAGLADRCRASLAAGAGRHARAATTRERQSQQQDAPLAASSCRAHQYLTQIWSPAAKDDSGVTPLVAEICICVDGLAL